MIQKAKKVLVIMKDSIKKFFAPSEKELFKNGFSWALGMFFGGEMTLDELEDHVQLSRYSGFDCNESAFDFGVLKAIRIIRDMGYSDEENFHS